MIKPANDPEAAERNNIERLGRLLWGPSWKSALADAIGVSKDSVSDWAAGRMTPRLGVYADLLRAAHQRQRDVAAAVAILETYRNQGLRALARTTRSADDYDDDER